MNIYFDENMPFAPEFFSEFGTLTAFNGRQLTAHQLDNANVLLVRSITKVNQDLLQNADHLELVGTATIGVDHIDQAYLAARNIEFHSAPGCNAVSVAEYVLSALVVMAERYQRDLLSLTIGIVGAGNTGSRLSEKLSALGIKHKLYDPPLAKVGQDKRAFVDFEQILACDVISLHVPLTLQGTDKTFHLFGEQELKQLKGEQWLINVCRGEVVDNNALLELKKQNLGPKLVWDVWENEPNILLPLMKYTDIATAHIAGYSLEGKARGTEMLYQALCHRLAKPVTHKLKSYLPQFEISAMKIAENFSKQDIGKLITLVYDVRRDDSLFRQQIQQYGFDYLRKNYPARREFSALSLTVPNTADTAWLAQLGFNLTDVN